MALVVSNKDLQNKLQASVSELDIGNDEENLGELCDLIYLPKSSNQNIIFNTWKILGTFCYNLNQLSIGRTLMVSSRQQQRLRKWEKENDVFIESNSKISILDIQK